MAGETVDTGEPPEGGAGPLTEGGLTSRNGVEGGAGSTVALPEETTPEPAPPPARRPVKRSRTGGMWVGLILAALVLLVLLIFILQNGQQVEISFFGAQGSLPLGVALLLAAIAGALLVAIPGSARILQLRRAASRKVKRVA